jgi:hypothetical protein
MSNEAFMGLIVPVLGELQGFKQTLLKKHRYR